MIIQLIFAGLLLYLYWGRSKWNNAPPGPRSIPIIGNLLQIALAHPIPTIAISTFSKKYREIFRLKFGLKDFVIVSSYDSITQVLSQNEAAGRYVNGSITDRQNFQNVGLAFSQGEIWETTRKWCVKELRNLGVNKTHIMEPEIQQICLELITQMDKKINPITGYVQLESEFIFHSIITKLIYIRIVGRCDKQDEIFLDKFCKENAKVFKSHTFGVGFANAFPFLRYLFPKWTKHDLLVNLFDYGKQIGLKILNIQRDQIQGKHFSTKSENLTEAYIKSDIPKDVFTDFHYQVLFLDFMQAGTDTSSSFLECCTLFLVLYPEVQERIYKEIEECVPKEHQLHYEDKKRMIYTSAVMLEIHRHITIIPHYLPRQALDDFYYKDYFIPKGTPIMPDLVSHYNDPKYWNEPKKFIPERFLNENGSGLNDLKNFLLPFGVGKRLCPEQFLGEMATFIILGNLVKKFVLSYNPANGEPRRDLQMAMTSRPYNFQLRILKRK